METHKRLSINYNLILTFFTLTAAFLSIVFFLSHSYQIITFPYELTSGEGLLLRDAVNIRNGQPMYTDVNEYPYIVSIYPPVFPLVAALFSHFTGISLLTTRLVSVISTLCIAFLIFSIVYKLTREIFIALFSGVVYISSLFVYQWSVFGRIDTLAILFSIASVAAVVIKPDRASISMAAILCTLSLYTKQTAIAAPIAIFLYLFIQHRHLSYYFVSVLIITGVSIFISLNTLTQGQFYTQIFEYNVQEYFLRTFLSFTRSFLILHPVLLLVAISYFLVHIKNRKLDIVTIYWLLAGIMTFTAGRAGSTINHFLEFIAVTSILFGLYWTHVKHLFPLAHICISCLFILQLFWPNLFQYTPLAQYYQSDPAFSYQPTDTELNNCKQLDQYIRQTDGSILAEEVGSVVANGKEAVGSAWMLNVLQSQGLIDQGYEELKTSIIQKQFDLILLHWQSYPSDLLFTVNDNYQNINTVECVHTWNIYVP